mmetsp:Transcript_8864/g.31327  ORF Transcript_8864/g.31327 Transcript_8864/m.31327 type:complete len:311 (+) Transcript_8864:980-1912(+)
MGGSKSAPSASPRGAKSAALPPTLAGPTSSTRTGSTSNEADSGSDIAAAAEAAAAAAAARHLASATAAATSLSTRARICASASTSKGRLRRASRVRVAKRVTEFPRVIAGFEGPRGRHGRGRHGRRWWQQRRRVRSCCRRSLRYSARRDGERRCACSGHRRVHVQSHNSQPGERVARALALAKAVIDEDSKAASRTAATIIKPTPRNLTCTSAVTSAPARQVSLDRLGLRGAALAVHGIHGVEDAREPPAPQPSRSARGAPSRDGHNSAAMARAAQQQPKDVFVERRRLLGVNSAAVAAAAASTTHHQPF